LTPAARLALPPIALCTGLLSRRVIPRPLRRIVIPTPLYPAVIPRPLHRIVIPTPLHPVVIPRPVFGRGICLCNRRGKSDGGPKQIPRFPSLPLGAGARDDRKEVSSRGQSLAEGSACAISEASQTARKSRSLASPRCRSGQALEMTGKRFLPVAGHRPTLAPRPGRRPTGGSPLGETACAPWHRPPGQVCGAAADCRWGHS
jgi:hypothetical protein